MENNEKSLYEIFKEYTFEEIYYLSTDSHETVNETIFYKYISDYTMKYKIKFESNIKMQEHNPTLYECYKMYSKEELDSLVCTSYKNNDADAALFYSTVLDYMKTPINSDRGYVLNKIHSHNRRR